MRGSLILERMDIPWRSLRTGGPLAPDTYTVTLRSAASGLRDDRRLDAGR
mgnify:CR=1 FL=1